MLPEQPCRPLLAINYSPQALSLLNEGLINFDLFKLPDWPDLVNEIQSSFEGEVYVHFDFHLGAQGFEKSKITEAKKLLGIGKTTHINTHFAPSNPEESLNQVSDEIEELLSHFDRDQILIENVPWINVPDYPIDPLASKPQAIARVVRETGCGFLMDLAHAKITCLEENLQIEPYLSALPTEHLQELHVTGVNRDSNGNLRDSMPITPEDWETVEWSLDRIASGEWRCPRIITLEYGGIGPKFEWRSDPDVIAQQLPQLERLLLERGLR